MQTLFNLRTTLAVLMISATSFAATSFAAWADPANYPGASAAVDAFVSALQAKDKAALLTVFGPESEDLISSGDADQDEKARVDFLDGYAVFHGLNDLGDDKMELVIGRVLWPFPIEIVKGDAGWHFDAAAAHDEIIDRRIGRNELDVIGVLRQAADVQNAFRNIDYDGDGVMEYAASILSTPGKHDGLYWPDEDGQPQSPLGLKMALASADGVVVDGVEQDPEPYLGYYFRILTKQGPDAPGGAYDYMVNGNMVAGYAVLAYPADPGNTGVMTFIVGENGVVYQSDLGDDTLNIAAGIDTFNPGKGWTVVDQ